MAQVVLTIKVWKSSDIYIALLKGIKNEIEVAGFDKDRCIEKCIEKIQHPELFDIIIEDETIL